jgi:hypothetical protein
MFVPMILSPTKKTGLRPGGGLGLSATVLLAVLAMNPALARAGGGGPQPGKTGSAKANGKAGPWMQLPLDQLGFPGISSNFLAAGTSMLTLHFVDDKHLLLTFSLRNLVPRLEGDPVDDDDRVVAAELLDLPSGKIAARTEWRMHDHGRYLWSLGYGRFLVRIADQLYTVEPMARLASGKPFLRAVFPSRRGRPSVVLVSPDGGLVTLETVVALASKSHAGVVFGDQDTAAGNTPPTKTLIDFIRIHEGKSEEIGIDSAEAGAVQASNPMLIPLDSDGYLWADQTDSNRWAMSFNEFGEKAESSGKSVDLGVIDSTCMPRLQMLDRGEFLAMTCHGGDDRIHMASYGLDGHETWEENVGDFGPPVFAFAPAAARFAVSHVSEAALAPMASVNAAEPEPVAHQEVRVYQNASGDLLLHADCTPVFKTAENFDLSPDGMELAVIRNGAIAIYKLPELGVHDREDMVEVEKFMPPATTAPVKLSRLTVPIKSSATPTVPDGDVTVAQGKVAVTAPATGTLSTGAAVEPPSQPMQRKPPTLLKPGEKPEFGKANTPGTGQEPQ